MQNINIPYHIVEDGYYWTLIGIKNNFAVPDTLVYAEYENQYGHIKQIDKRHLISQSSNRIRHARIITNQFTGRE